MRKILSLAILAFALNGCMLSGPMALLPPTAKFIMWGTSEPEEEAGTKEAISVQALLQNARGFSSKDAPPKNIQISYEDHVLDDERLNKIAGLNSRTLEMICGPYEYGAPIDAASMALRTCYAIKKQLAERGLTLNVRFSPDAPKGQAVLKPLLIIEADDA